VSATDSTGVRAGLNSWWQQIDLNVRATIATLLRTPRRAVLWPSYWQLGLAAAAAVAVVVLTMVLLDGWSIAHVRRLPVSLIQAFDRLTDYGKSGWFLWPIGLVLLALALSDSPTQPRFQRQVLAAWSVRLGFVFTAIALPGLFATTVKRLIGRARPFVEGNDVWAYIPFGWKVEYASLPSGHATTAFSALVAIGAILPQARALLWIYAVMIAFSRVVVGAHHPSDVVAGAIVGTVGALLVRHWFAARRLGFWVGPGGAVHPMPGPNLWRIVKAVARRAQSA
jgi:membrane-associated phospholipid phosphatase